MESRLSVYGIAEGVWHHRRCIFCGLIPYCLATDSIPQQVGDYIHGSAVINTRQYKPKQKSENIFFIAPSHTTPLLAVFFLLILNYYKNALIFLPIIVIMYSEAIFCAKCSV